ncbi:ATPase [Dulcicalothrix desertica PCC 7102]|uniref:ATPase n=1 Tax=Dulcicalothrix desertica PCC 7102 TaxID=232991 RepID=A0A433VMM5_9CYAN|nr:heavy metal translocating P-type ATPase [Dulcicalothrix desertica]RUT07321.1 ATPase [Dulcicalothrix desertica PCC 7102]TWH55480.1 P-type E1-E2 ATPase/heavy metal translocating P-type ATPase [Dulcicalothrix desertica PCC 7102]
MPVLPEYETLILKQSPIQDYEIIHVTRERFRIRISRLASDPEYASKLTWLVEYEDFVLSVRISLLSSSLIVNYDPDVPVTTVQSSLLKCIEKASQAEVPAGIVPIKTESRPEIDWIERLGLPILSLSLAVLSTQVMPIPAVALGALVTTAAIPFVSRIIEIVIKERRLDSDILDAIWLGLYTLKGDFVGPSLMLSLMYTGDALRDVTARASERQVFDLLSSMDKFARLERDGVEVLVPLKEVQKGDRVVVYPGEIIPVSGRVLRGTALIDEHRLTGESTLVSRSEGQVVHASTLVLEGKISVLTKRLGSNTRVGLTVQLLQSAPVHDTRVEDYAAKVADATIVPSMLLSGAIFVLTQDVSRSLAPLHLDFSHNIRIAVPSTIIAALTFAARHGVYIRSGRALEMLARIDTIVFDKTGTLTQGNAEVVEILTASSTISSTEVLEVAASAEQGNTHPVAGAILRYAEAQNIQTQPCSAWDYRIGFGVVAEIGGEKILAGSHRLISQEGIDLNPIYKYHPQLQTGSHSTVYVAKGGELLGVILYTDPARAESAEVISTLENLGNETYMLTGDSKRVANHVAKQLGIKNNHVYAESFPDQKVEVIRQFQSQERTVAFIGEGINDAAALAHADVSISFASGIDIARETADVVLLEDDLRGIASAIAIAKQAMDIVYQNTALIAIPNIGVVLAGVLFAFDPVLGVIISNGSALVAELNSFRPLFESGFPTFNPEPVKSSPTPESSSLSKGIEALTPSPV